MNTLPIIVIAGGLAVLLPLVIIVATMVPLWTQARTSGVPVPFSAMLGMRLRRLNPHFMVGCLITLRKAGVDIQLDNLEAHALAGGNVGALTDAAVAARKAGLDVTMAQIAAIDLAGRNIRDAVETCVEPKVLTCPHHAATPITGVAQDGIRIGVRVRVTVRTNLQGLVGGANEQTIVARVGEGIVAAIGRAASHQEILETPDGIAHYILSHGLDSGTAFEILSVDVSDIDVLDNVGARLMEEQAEADKQVAQAKAEMRRAFAVAGEQEMRARVREMVSYETSAKANVPSAMAAALYRGWIWRSPRPVRPVSRRILWATAGD